nr:zinc-binding alcohol dehydrogenase family protein [Microbacterium sp. ARD32]
MRRHGARFDIGPAPYTPPRPGEVVVRARAVGLNIIDSIPRVAYRAVLPWVRLPTVIGGDAAGEIVEVGAGVSRLRVGDRVVGHALGLERSRNRAAEGAFQQYVVLMERMVSPIPDSLSFAQAAVLPLQLSTAATGLFQPDTLDLALPGVDAIEREETVLVWGGSTGVGSNAIQLARGAGYRVVATASPHNFGYVRSLGAAEVVDRRSPAAVGELVAAIGEQPLAGSIAIGRHSLRRVMRVASLVPGTRRVVSSATAPAAGLGSLVGRRGVRVRGIWGAALKDTPVGAAVYTRFLPAALASGRYAAAPPAEIVGSSLADIPQGLRRLREGISAKKLVVTLGLP